MGNYAFWSRIALVAAILPAFWGVVLLSLRPQGLSKYFAWATIGLGLLVVVMGRDFGHVAFMEIVDLLGMKR